MIPKTLLLMVSLAWAGTARGALKSHFECKELGGNAYRPYYLQVATNGTEYYDYSKINKGLLGQNAMASLDECKKAVEAANNDFGVICSRTGLDGWKPTLYTGTAPGRRDFGYLGGSSIKNFADCLKATKNSSKKGVCFWGGSQWYVSPINKEGVAGGPFNSIDQCVAQTKVEEEKPAEKPKSTHPNEERGHVGH